MSKVNFKNILKIGAHVHFMGVCGTAMGSLAVLFKDKGFRVTGSDQNVYPPMSDYLKDNGVEVTQGYKAQNLHPQPDFVVVGNVIRKDMEESQELLKLDIPYGSLPEVIGDWIIDEKHSIVMSGTHGKTTTTTMMTMLAKGQGVDTGYFIGGVPKGVSRSFHEGKDPYFVIEGDEYDSAFFLKEPKFLCYRPSSLCINGVEFDHADIYKNVEEIISKFHELVKLIPEEGQVVYFNECKYSKDIVAHTKAKRVKSFGFKDDADYQIKNLNTTLKGITFEVHTALKVTNISLPFFGEHMALNATACFALSQGLGWDDSKALSSLASFQGVKRRQEKIAEIKGCPVFEDFAHHPTAVKKTLDGFRKLFPEKTLWALFEPRSATSRRNHFQQEYVEALSLADKALVTTPYDQSRIPESERFNSDKLILDLKEKNTQACILEPEQMAKKIKDEVTQEGDIIIIMSNGAFGGIYDLLKE